MPMQLADPLLHILTQPSMERQGAIAEVIGEPLGRLQQRLLHHVGRVDPRGQAPVEPDRRHAGQSLVIPDQ